MLPNKIADAKTPEWHALRKTGIGASEAAAACGLSPYSTRRHLYHEKIGELEQNGNEELLHVGNLMEPTVQYMFEYRTGIKVAASPMGLYRSSENPFMLATPDALLESNELAEWKTTTWRRGAELGEQESDHMPHDWVVQAQQQMYVVGLDVCHVAVFLDIQTLKTYRVERNDRLIEGIIEAEDELWQRIENRDPPPPIEHPRTLRLAREISGTPKNSDVMFLSAEGAECWKRKRQAGRLGKRLKSREEFELAKVIFEIGKHHAGVLPGGEKMIRRKRIRAEVAAHTKDYIEAREVKVPKPTLRTLIEENNNGNSDGKTAREHATHETESQVQQSPSTT